MSKMELLSSLKTIQVSLISILLLLFPIFFLTNTLDTYILPKQILFTVATCVLLIIYAIKLFLEDRITIITSPLNFILCGFFLTVLFSSLFSIHLFDSLTQSLPVFLLLLFYIVGSSVIDDILSYTVVFSSLIIGGVASALITLLYHFNIQLLPFITTETQNFNTFGSILQHMLYLTPLFVLCLDIFIRSLKTKHKTYLLPLSGFVAALFGTTIVYLLIIYINKPLLSPLLPYQYGLQIAAATISQDTSRLFQNLFFGSGFGTFLIDFTRYKGALFNQEQALWNIPFGVSSSFALELLATTGILGFITYIILCYKTIKIKQNHASAIFPALASVLLLSFVFPFTYPLLFLLVVLITLFTSSLYLEKTPQVYKVHLTFVAFQEGLIQLTQQPNKKTHKGFPIAIAFLLIAFTGFVAYYSFSYFLSDVTFKSSLTQSNLQKGLTSYTLQKNAMTTYPYRSDYFRIFSQLNLALATSIFNSVPQNSTPSAEQQQNALTFLKQSIDSGKRAIALAPASSLNWESMGSVYRSMINVGASADQFSISSLNQAVLLDPSNPQLYIELGGVFYQLGQYDAAISQFTVAARLKPDLPNAYYNLGHSYEAKGELQNALSNYQIVKELVKTNSQNLSQITKEIEGISQKIGKTAATPTQQNVLSATETKADSQLQIATPSAQLPKRNVKVNLPPPPATASESAK